MNPYNYQEPISEISELADRENSVNEIEYYLNEAASGSLFDIAITGEHGIGKSSLMNIGSNLAEELGIMSIDVPLGQLNTVDELEFYRGLFEEILSQGISQGYIEQSRLDSFRDAIAGTESEISIGYSSTYYRIKSGSENAGDLSRNQIIDDLKEIYRSVESPAIALFLDKANLLVEKNYLFRKFYSVINNTDGFILILSDDSLNDTIPNDISPLRQSFTTIKLSEFEEQQSTKESLLKPLSDAEESDFDQESISDIHRITKGHPYEIKLIAHHMYKNYQLGSESITMDSEVLADVANSLEAVRTSRHERLFDKVKQLSDDQLRLLVYLLEITGASEEWLVRYSILKDVSSFTERNIQFQRENRRRLLTQLEDLGLIERTEEGLEFAGETFDRLFLKYHAVDRGELDIDQFKPDRSRSPRTTVYHEIIRQGFENQEYNYRFITKYDFAHDTLPEDEDSKLIQWQTIHKTGEVTVESGERTTILKWKIGEFVEESEDSIWYRCNMTWVPTGFVTKVTVIEDIDEKKEHLREKVKRLSSKLEVLDYEFILEDEMTLFNQSKKAFENGNLDKSEQLLKQAVDVNPLFDSAWRNLGLIGFERGNYKYARVCYRMGLIIERENTDLHQLLADAYRMDGLYNKAKEVLENSLTHESTQTNSTLLKLYQIELDSGDFESAKETFSRYWNTTN